MKRVLAIDPITKGFGFVVLDGPEFLVDWGLKGTRQTGEPRNRSCLRQIADLIDFYQPDRVVLEDCLDHRSRRGRRSRRLIERIAELARERRVPIRHVSRSRLMRAFAPVDVCTKYKVALAVAGRFPELRWRLPPIRKPWMSEDARMGIFDAAGLALAFFARRGATQDGRSDTVTPSALKGGDTAPSTMRRR